MDNNKKLLIGLSVVGLLLLAYFAGNAGSSDSNNNVAPTPTNTWTPEPPAPNPVYVDEQSYLDTVNGTYNEYVLGTSDSELLDYGYGICDYLDSGYDLYDIIDLVVENTTDPEEAEAWGAITAGAMLYLCPEYDYMLDDLDTTYQEKNEENKYQWLGSY